jgi:rubrerythrin
VLQKIEHVCEAFHSMIKGNSTPATGSSTESNSQKPRVPTDNHHRHHQKEEKENIHTKSYKAKLERLDSARLTRRDQAVKDT